MLDLPNTESRRTRQSYDHRFREVVKRTGNVDVAVQKGVPRSTARDWARLAAPQVISLDVASMTERELREEILDLRERHTRALAILRLLVALVKVCDVSLRSKRVPDGEKKRLFLRTVDKSRKVLSLRGTLRVLGLSKTRYHDWKRGEECELEDASSCPQSHPQQLTADERHVVRDMVTSDEYRHGADGNSRDARAAAREALRLLVDVAPTRAEAWLASSSEARPPGEPEARGPGVVTG